MSRSSTNWTWEFSRKKSWSCRTSFRPTRWSLMNSKIDIWTSQNQHEARRRRTSAWSNLRWWDRSFWTKTCNFKNTMTNADSWNSQCKDRWAILIDWLMKNDNWNKKLSRKARSSSNWKGTLEKADSPRMSIQVIIRTWGNDLIALASWRPRVIPLASTTTQLKVIMISYLRRKRAISQNWRRSSMIWDARMRSSRISWLCTSCKILSMDHQLSLAIRV